MVALTSRMLQAYEFISAYDRAHGICPSQREIAQSLGITSMSTTNYLVKSLVERGHLTRLPGKRKARNLALVETTP